MEEAQLGEICEAVSLKQIINYFFCHLSWQREIVIRKLAIDIRYVFLVCQVCLSVNFLDG